MASHASTSFCRNLLQTIDLESHLKKIHQTFSKYITVKRKFSADHQKDEPVIYVLEVDVDYRNDKISVVEKVCETIIVIWNLLLYNQFNVHKNFFLIFAI